MIDATRSLLALHVQRMRELKQRIDASNAATLRSGGGCTSDGAGLLRPKERKEADGKQDSDRDASGSVEKGNTTGNSNTSSSTAASTSNRPSSSSSSSSSNGGESGTSGNKHVEKQGAFLSVDDDNPRGREGAGGGDVDGSVDLLVFLER